MKKLITYALLFLFIVGLAEAYEPKKIFILHSYDPSLSNVKDNNKGIFDALNGKSLYGFNNNVHIKYRYKTFYMDTKRKSDEQHIRITASLALKKIRLFKPDLIISVDDNAALAVVKSLKNTSTPIVICDINGDPVEYGLIDSFDRSGSNVVAVVERQNYKELIKLSRLLVKNLKKIVVLVDDSITSKAEISYFSKMVNESDLRIVIESTGSWEEWKRIVLRNQSKYTIIFPLLFYTLKDSDGKVINQDVAIRWLLNNSKIAELGGTSFQVKDGFLASISTWSDAQGYMAGLLAQRIFEGENTKEMPVILPKVSSIDVNLERAKLLGIKIPFDILSNATIYHKAEALYRPTAGLY